MPIYEYECRACGDRFELLVLGSECPACPACESENLERLLSLPSVSSDGTRSRSRAEAKKRGRGARQDQAAGERDPTWIHDEH